MRSAVAFIVAVSALLASYSAAFAQTKLTLGYGSASAWIASFVAADKGIFAKHDLDVTMRFVPSAATQPAALTAGSLDIGTFNAPLLVLADEGGLDLRIVAGGTSEQGKDKEMGRVMAREDSGIKTARDFRGRRIGIPGRNSVLHVSLMKWLKDNGVDPSQESFVEIGMPQLSDMLKSRQIDGAVSVEPFAGQIEKNKTGYRVSLLTADFAFYAMSRGFIEKNPQALAAFRASITEAADYANVHPDEARHTQITFLKLPEAVAMQTDLPVYSSVVTAAEVRFWLDACKDLGVTKGTLTVDAVLAK
ncbi:MAG TPA: ABC transporter substrate-binding protein [Stellaceae bacterium]|jgi:NitT/TauT family transport system substrate-binding protein|nr:ABC transporter substrate-binding protein [Stellaceae bacterium]